ncbi:hypothetical protein EW146_g5473 [Bondarzewia mesenterica]|uniref:CNNM transmembrane domain-containing protein n=1 Tax=Bondarzewia mesenterica TaxID=1095465 RepID=A0A4S4LTH0_9AGAM|nr:hypothetical protein EW146_g5473 [Bondarzewia mesenterica]
MVPPPLHTSISPSSSLLLSLAASVSQHVPNLSTIHSLSGFGPSSMHTVAKREESQPHDAKFIAFATLMPVLVILSGLFAGLTLGYMSLDETQLQVLSISGTPLQRKYANKIMPIRKNGHLLLVTLLLANMITNETLPVISDPILGGGVQSVVVSTILIVIFAEIIPQSVCTRHGLLIGAKMAPVVRVLLWTLGLVAWPVAKLLEYVLGPHHGIIYRRAELKELIAMHSSMGVLGGDLRSDTITIIGATLDLQEKTAKQAMTKIDNVFMLSIDAKLDYDTLRQVCATGHSRVPVYEEVEMPDNEGQLVKVKKILGVLLVKQCVLLDPKDAVPVRSVPLNKVPSVAQNEPLLGILDKFQEGRSHMAIVSRFSVEKAASVKKAVKKGLTQRIRDRVGISDSSSSDSESEEDGNSTNGSRTSVEPDAMLKGDGVWERDFAKPNLGGSPKEERRYFSFRKRSKGRRKRTRKTEDLEMGTVSRGEDEHAEEIVVSEDAKKAAELQKAKKGNLSQLPIFAPGLEQSMPADAVLGEGEAGLFLQGFDPSVSPLGIITLEDVLEELIGEEIYDEFDNEGARHGELSGYVPPQSMHLAPHAPSIRRKGSAPQLSGLTQFTIAGVPSKSLIAPTPVSAQTTSGTQGIIRPIAIPAFKGLSFLTARSRSAPPTPRGKGGEKVKRISDEAELGEEDEKSVTVVDNGTPQTHSPPPMSAPVPTPSIVMSGYGAEEDIRPTARAPQPGILRGASPSPSLEAIIFDRSRSRRAQQQAQVGASVGGGVPRVSISNGSGKGGRFKSSPLVSGLRVVSEGESSDAHDGEDAKEEERRIPDERDKMGPGKDGEKKEDVV